MCQCVCVSLHVPVLPGQTHSQQQDIITEYEDKIYSRNLEIKNLKNKKHNEILELTQSLKNTNDMLQNVKTQHEILYDKFTQESIIASDNAHQVQLYKDFWNVLEDEFKCSEFVGESIFNRKSFFAISELIS